MEFNLQIITKGLTVFALVAIFLMFALSLLSSLTVHGAAASMEDTQDLDTLINEFITDTKNSMQKSQSDEDLSQPSKEFVDRKVDNSKPNAAIPLNAKPEFFRSDKCNCTNFYKCDVGDKSFTSVTSEEPDEEDGSDLSLINIRLNVPKGGCDHYLEICCEVD
jgi:hypothetical protein